MDNGISIKDENVKHVILDVYDFETIVQCVGRKRIEKDEDFINVYIRHPLGNVLRYPLQNAQRKVRIAEDRTDSSKEIYETMYKKFKDHDIVDNDGTINYAAFIKAKWDVDYYQQCIKDSNFFVNKIKDYFQKSEEPTKYYIYADNDLLLKDYLNVVLSGDKKVEFQAFF